MVSGVAFLARLTRPTRPNSHAGSADPSPKHNKRGWNPMVLNRVGFIVLCCASFLFFGLLAPAFADDATGVEGDALAQTSQTLTPTQTTTPTVTFTSTQ